MLTTKISLAPGVVLGRHIGYVDDHVFVPAVTDSLQAWHNIGVSRDHAARNWAPGQPDATVVGAPVIGDGFALMTSLSSYLQSDAAEVDEFTWFAVARSDVVFGAGVAQAAAPTLISDYQGGPGASDGATTSLGSLFWWASTTGSITGQACRRDGVSAPITGTTSGLVAASTPATWAAYAMICANGSLQVKNLTTGAASPVQAFTPPRFRGTRKLRIGSAYTTSAGACQMANAAMYSKVQSGPEMAAVYAQLQEYQLRRWGRTI